MALIEKLINSNPHRYRAERVYVVSVTEPAWVIQQGPVVCAYGTKQLDPTFAHVLNVPASEEVWPEDAAELFFREYFAMRLAGDDQVYHRPGPVWNHIREEILRLCEFPENQSLETVWTAQHQVHCYMLNGSFAKELFGEDISQSRPHETNWDAEPFSSEFDDPEPDTLNSELLLTDEYLGPVPGKEGLIRDSVSSNNKTVSSSISPPNCRAGTTQPTEQGD